MWLEAFDSDDMNTSCIEHVIHSGKPHELSHEYVSFLFLLNLLPLSFFSVTWQLCNHGVCFSPQIGPPYLSTHHGIPLARPKIMKVTIGVKIIPPHGMLLPPGGGAIPH